MAEKKEGESSDSEAYMSADEGPTSSRGDEKRPLDDRLVESICTMSPLLVPLVPFLYVKYVTVL